MARPVCSQKALIVGPPVDQQMPARAGMLDQFRLLQFGAGGGVFVENGFALIIFGHPGPDHGDHHQQEHQHETTAADPDRISGDPEHDRQHEAAQPADQADDAADHAHLSRKMIGQTAINAGLAEALSQSDHEHQHGKQHNANAEVEGNIALDAMNDQGGRWITEQEQANQADPQHPPGHGVAAPFVRGPAAEGANRSGRQIEEDGQKRGGRQGQAVFADVVFRQPQRQRHEPAEHEGVGQTEPPDPGVEQGRQLLAETGSDPVFGHALFVQWIGIGEEPEQHRHDHHRHGVDLRHHLPRAKGANDQRGDELGQRGTGVARAENPHRRALPLLAEPGRGVGDADRKRTAGQADEQAQGQVVPVFGGVGQQPGRDRHQQHLDEKHNPPAVAVGEKAQR